MIMIMHKYDYALKMIDVIIVITNDDAKRGFYGFEKI